MVVQGETIYVEDKHIRAPIPQEGGKTMGYPKAL